MQNREVQVGRLKATKEWLEEHERIINSRLNQGVIRYKALRRRGQSLQNSPEKDENKSERVLNIPSEMLATTMLPYKKKWRSSHQEHGIPS